MFYTLNVSFRNINGQLATQRFSFEHYSNGYVFQDRRMNDLLGCHPDWTVASDGEERDFNHGTYLRTIILNDKNGQMAATLKLESDFFMDALVDPLY